MRAAHIVQNGAPEEAIEIVDVDTPDPGPEEVRVRIEVCALNHKDVFARVGHPNREDVFPKRVGTDVAGVVDEVGKNVTEWEQGDRVVLYPRAYCDECEWCLNGEHTMCENPRQIGNDIPGGLAEYATFPAFILESIPDDVDFVTAASWPVTFTTAWRMISTAGQLRPSESSLILGASGGVGNAALQIANRIGSFTYATTSLEEKAEKLRDTTEAVIDYTAVDFSEEIMERTDGRGVDLVADHIGQDTWQTSIDSLAKNGRMVICGATSGPDPDIDIRSVYQNHRRIIGAPLGNRQDFRDVGRLVYAGELVPQIDRVLPLDGFVEGSRVLEEREAVGKIVIEPRE